LIYVSSLFGVRQTLYIACSNKHMLTILLYEHLDANARAF